MTDSEYIKDRREKMDLLFEDVKKIKAHLIGTLTTEGLTVRVNKGEKEIREIKNIITERTKICENRHDIEKAYETIEKKKNFTWVHAGIIIQSFLILGNLLYSILTN